MQPLKTKAIILRRTNYNEADRILQVITPGNGKLGIIAKGVRREKSKLASAVELFSVSDITVARGRSGLGVLTSARLEHFYRHILKDYDRLQLGYEVVKRVASLSEHTSEKSLYTLAHTALQSLDTMAIDLRIVKAWFYLQLAELTGHGLNLSRDDKNKALKVDSRYRFDIAQMSFIEQPAGAFTSNHLKLLKIMKIKNPQVIAHISGIEDYLDDCLSLAHAVGE